MIEECLLREWDWGILEQSLVWRYNIENEREHWIIRCGIVYAR